MRISIVTDSTCDLSEPLIQKYRITVLPLYVTLGDQSYQDGINITSSDIFRYVEQNGNLPKTAAISVAAYADCFRALAKDADAVLCITLGSGFSSCCQNARIAAADFENVYVVDSCNLSTGHGHVVLQACEHQNDFSDAASLADFLSTQVVPKVDASFIIDRLDYLHKGGRCSAVAALGANMLKLKPCIEVRNGKMAVGKKYRGQFAHCVSQYIKDRLHDTADIDPHRIFITHAQASDDALSAAKETVTQCANFSEVLETQAGSTIASHCGPNTLGILYLHK